METAHDSSSKDCGSLPAATGIQSVEGSLRQRRNLEKGTKQIDANITGGHGEADEKVREEVTFGRTPSGVVFRVPQTHSFLHTLLTTLHRSSLTRLTLFSLVAQPILFVLLRCHPTVRSVFFLLYFAFWRGSYDWGFAWALRRQSEKRWIVRLLRSRGWLDTKSEQGGERGRAWARWWQRELEMKVGEGYNWEELPPEFNAWLIFRQLVDVVLLNDFVSYSCFAWANLHFPPNHSITMHLFRWVFGWSLIFFNLWVKMDAHRVVKDYAWYWGDAFWLIVMQNDLVFDGVYEIAPHPMYSVGYAGYYGLSMGEQDIVFHVDMTVVGSYTVLFVSLAAHAAQFAFLLWFENPHIERIYGDGKKPLASRVPIVWGGTYSQPFENGRLQNPQINVVEENHANNPDTETPPATEGDTETEPELPELPELDQPRDSGPAIRKPRSDSSYSTISMAPMDGVPPPKPALRNASRRSKSISMHDLRHRFFRKPVVVLWRLDPFRSTDFALVILVIYAISTLVPALPPRLALTAHLVHALTWRIFHSFGLGLLLRAQSKRRWLVRHYLKHYHYPGDTARDQRDNSPERESVVRRATEEAFGNWQVGYNISLVMTYVSFTGLAWKTYHLPIDWTVSGIILRHVLGFLLVALHVWAAMSSFEVLGEFGWLYSDFFLIEQVPSQLAYTGIYRFLNNPERSMGGAAFFGMWLISNSKLVLALAVVSHLSHWWFLSNVERPHMEALYGDRLRKDGGLTKTLKSVADKTLATKAGKHGPEIKRVVEEVRGSLEKVEERMTEAVEEFFYHARPMFSEMISDTKNLFQQSRERLTITRTANDISAYDMSRYSLTLPSSSSDPSPRFQVGEPIRVSWTAPSNHSRKDWIGLYRYGSCKSQLVTRIASLGCWMPIYEDEYDGDTPVNSSEQTKCDAGEVVFRGHQVPWTPGRYELRYHHDGKHNVMSRVGPIDIYVKRPLDDSFLSIHETMLNIVFLSLDSDVTLIPSAAKPPLSDKGSQSLEATTPAISAQKAEEVGRDPDDFIIMSETQAKRIVSMSKTVFDVELSADVVIADANVRALARRVLGARSLLGDGARTRE